LGVVGSIRSFAEVFEVKDRIFFSPPRAQHAGLAVLLNSFNMVGVFEKGNSVRRHADNIVACPETGQRPRSIAR
jgi:hypothetical protein